MARSSQIRIASALLVGISIAGLWLGLGTDRLQRLQPSPRAHREWNAYDDRSRRGESRCEVIDAGDTLRAAVRLGFASDAYWGLEWGPGIQGNAPLALWSWAPGDSLIFVWRARHATSQRIFLCSHDAHLTSSTDPLSRRYLAIDLPIGKRWTRAAIALSEFEPPAWWLGLHPGLPDPHKAYLRRIVAMQVGPGSGVCGVDDTLEIASIDRKPGFRLAWLAALSGLGVLGGVVLFAFAGYCAAPSVGDQDSPLEALLEPRPLDAPLPDLDRLNRFLADCYHRADLDLATVAKELLMPVRRVTTLLNASGGGFKAVLNRLRSQEARRLLSETDLQISEIAFKVGYGNVSHFNRVFRERFGIAPGAMRAALRNRHDPVQNPSKAENVKDSTDHT